MRELEAEDHEAFANFLRVPPDMYRELEERLAPRLMEKDTWYREALKPGLKLATPSGTSLKLLFYYCLTPFK